MRHQGTEAWRQQRLGMVTASKFSAVLTQPRSKAAKVAKELSDTAFGYWLDLIGEYMTGMPSDVGLTGAALEWGRMEEPNARAAYCVKTGVGLTEVGFVRHASGLPIGGSPDAFIGSDGGLEIKCPYSTRNHVRAWLRPEWFVRAHAPQVQGLLWLTGRKWWDLLSYDPRCLAEQTVIVRCEPDPEMFAKFDELVIPFAERLMAEVVQRKLGVQA